jgi:dihydroneopterin aldolase
MDKIYLKEYTVIAKHGYYKEEHAKAQRFVVSVVATCDTHHAGKTDDLKETLNYERIRSIVYDILMQSPRSLLEALAEEISSAVLTIKNVSSVEVDIRKPDVWNDCIPGVCIVRGR